MSQLAEFVTSQRPLVVPAQTRFAAPRMTFSVTTTVFVRLMPVPVTLRAKLPGGVFVVVLTLRVELPLPLNEGGLNAAVASDGRPARPKATVPVKLLLVTTVSVKFVLPPGATVCVGGVADIEKLPTCSAMRFVCATPPLVPTTESV